MLRRSPVTQKGTPKLLHPVSGLLTSAVIQPVTTARKPKAPHLRITGLKLYLDMWSTEASCFFLFFGFVVR